MAHAGSARRENRQIGAALALQLELVALDAFADFVVGHFQGRARRHRGLVLGVGRRGLLFAETMQVLGLGGVVAVAIDDHDGAPYRARGCWGEADATARGAIVKRLRGSSHCALPLPSGAGGRTWILLGYRG